MVVTVARDRDPVAARRPVLLIVGVLSAFFAILVDASGTIVLQSAIARDLEVGQTAASLSYTCYFIAYAAPLLVAGRVGDRLGPTRVLYAGMVAFVLAGLVSALATGLPALLVCRILQGVFGGIAAPQLLAVLKLHVPPSLRAKAMTANGVVVVLAFFLGPSVAGLAALAGSWRVFFAACSVLGLFALVCLRRAAPSRRPQLATAPDPTSVVLSVAGPVLVAGGLVLVGGSRPPIGVALTVVGLLVVAAFLAHERRAPTQRAIAPREIFRSRNFVFACVTTLQLGFATTAMLAAVMNYLETERGFTELQAGLLLTPMAGVAMALAPLVARHTSREREWALVLLGFVVFAAGIGALAFAGDAIPSPALYVLSGWCGIACVCVFGPLSAVAMRDVDPTIAGAASGTYNFTRQFGAAVGAAALVVVGTHVPTGLGEHLGAGRLGPALLLTTVVMATAGVTAAVALRGRRPPPPTSPSQ